MRTIAIMNNKGGVGKTVTAVNLADILVRQHGKQVVLADCDGQRNATRFFWQNIPDDAVTVAELLTGQAEPLWSDNLHTVYPGLQLLPASSGLSWLDIHSILNNRATPHDIHPRALLDFRKGLEDDGEIDYFLFDCPSSFTTAACAALMAADEVVIPTVLDGFSFDGIDQMDEQVRQIRFVNRAVKISGVLINQWHRAPHVEQAEALLRSRSVPVFHSVIRRTDKVPESTLAREPLPLYSPNSAAGRDFRFWVEELIGEEGVGNEV